uniref:Uncharacterized protein n=1 Tax=Octopus bimaculoides TaxID=37653 RepID=A0A0L8IDN5_OCTBM
MYLCVCVCLLVLVLKFLINREGWFVTLEINQNQPANYVSMCTHTYFCIQKC